jgi:Flp pilus assembly protein TadG
MRSDRGSVTFWMLGLSILLLLFGGLAIDLWRGLAVQRELAAIADSAAVAAASGIDEEHYRITGELLLDRSRAILLGEASAGSQGVDLTTLEVAPAADALSVTVSVVDELELGLLGLFVEQTEPLVIRATATARPALVP